MTQLTVSCSLSAEMHTSVREILVSSEPDSTYFLRVDWRGRGLGSGFLLVLTDGQAAWRGEGKSHLMPHLNLKGRPPCVFALRSGWGGAASGGGGAGDARGQVHPGPSAGADGGRRLRPLQLRPDAVSTERPLHCYAGIRESAEGHLGECHSVGESVCGVRAATR